MARPLRIAFPGAIYHVTARGDRHEPIFEDDIDRLRLLHVVGLALRRFNARMLSYCLMGNHYHFVLQTHEANLSLLMRHVNGVYTQRFNRRHQAVGHLFQGRFKAILVDSDAYLLEACRYVELNPVRAGFVPSPQAWPWSSYRAHTGEVVAPDWLDTALVAGHALGRSPRTIADWREGRRRHQELVASARDVTLWESALRQQIYLGDDAFVDRMQSMDQRKASAALEIPKLQRSRPLSLAQWIGLTSSREEALFRAHRESGISMTALAKEIGVSISRVSQLIRGREAAETPFAHSSSPPPSGA